MHRSLASSVARAGLAAVLLAVPALSWGQTEVAAPSIEGQVCDAQDHPLAGATVLLEKSGSRQPASATTDAHGRFRFSKLTAGDYTLHAKLRDFAETSEGPLSLNEQESKSLVFHLQKADSGVPPKDAADIPFSDETHFTVAGVTDTTSLGGHGSDPVRRNSDALSKEAAHLSDSPTVTRDEAVIRERLAKEDNADLRFQLAEIEEKAGRPLDAVNDYQRAAEKEPTEPHLFAWGAELLLHRAFDPAIEVFARGRRLYPHSVRMVLGLGSATYARGSSDEAKRIFVQACDIVPADQTPYLFLGRVQATESGLPDGWTERLRRFVELNPDSATAHYFYAVALLKKSGDHEAEALAESQLRSAIRLEPHLGDAYKELGIVALRQGDLPGAAVYLQQAIANTPLPDDAHYRLAQVYRRMGEAEKARREAELYKQVSEQKNQQVERERHELQQFVYTLREQKPSSQDATAPQ